jgi:protein PsiE
MRRQIDRVGGVLVDGFHYLALFAIGGAIVWSAVYAFLGMAAKGHATIEDILLLFIYLELGAMVGIYFKTNHMPVRFLIYVAITALTRLLIGDIQAHHRPDWGVVMVTGAILLLALANLVVRYGSARYPSASVDDRR